MKKKKITTLLLSLMIVFSLFPTTARAEDKPNYSIGVVVGEKTTLPQKVKVGGQIYKITEKETAALLNAKKASKITVPSTIKVKGNTYIVTAVSANAFKNNKKVKSVVIGKYVKTIGKNAFYGCSNLKTMKIKSKSLTTVGKNTFKKTEKITLKVPAGKKNAYTKLMKKGSFKGTVKEASTDVVVIDEIIAIK